MAAVQSPDTQRGGRN